MFLSIVAPVYNVKDYLSAFFQSVLQQQVCDFELIFVDDGSTDGSGKLCDEFARHFSFVHVIHQQNSGASSARNSGAKIAKGKYLLFVDSDDVMNHKALVSLYKLLHSKNFDIIVCPADRINSDGKIDRYSYQDFENYNRLYPLVETIAKYNNQIPWAPYQYIYNRHFYCKNKLKFSSYYDGAEDLKMFLDVYKLNPQIAILPNAIMIYRVGRKGSLDNTKKFQTVNAQLNAFIKAFTLFKNDIILRNYFARRFTNIIIQSEMVEQNRREYLFRLIKKNKNIMKYAKGGKYTLAKMIWNIFGFRLGSNILIKLRK